MTQWSDFQTALQFVAGLNVALYGVPELRAPGIGNELRQEDNLVRLANEHGLFAAAIIYQGKFTQQWSPLIRQFKRASMGCLIMGSVVTLVLFRASGQWSASSPNLWFAWGTILVGLLPTAVLAWLNLMRSPSHRKIFRIAPRIGAANIGRSRADTLENGHLTGRLRTSYKAAYRRGLPWETMRAMQR